MAFIELDFTVDVPYRTDAKTGRPVGKGRFVVRDLRWDGDELSDSIGGDILLEPTRLRLNDVSAVLAGGLLRLTGSYPDS